MLYTKRVDVNVTTATDCWRQGWRHHDRWAG